MRASGKTIIFLAALLLLIPASSASVVGELGADSLEIEQGAVEAPGALLWVREAVSEPTRSFSMHLEATSLTGELVEFTTPYLVADTEIGPELSQPVDKERESRTPVSSTENSWDTVGFEDIFSIMVQGGQQTTANFAVEDFSTVGAGEAAVCGYRLQDVDSSECESATETMFAHAPTGPVVISKPLDETVAHRFQFTFTGDLSLTFTGIDLASLDGSQLASRTVREDGPGGVTREQTLRFLQLQVKDATLTLSSDAFFGTTDWAAPTQVIQPDGLVRFNNAFGTFRGETLDGDDVYAMDLDALDLSPDANQVNLLARESKGSTNLLTAAMPEIPEGVVASTLMFVGAAFLVAAIGVGVYAAAKAGQRASMPRVEAAIEAGQYRTAARMARRLQRRNPNDEGITVARAVALSKAGRHKRVVREVGTHLEDNAPEDGVLHYVLGLAYMETQQRDRAVKSLRTAFELTPELEDGAPPGTAPVAPIQGNAYV